MPIKHTEAEVFEKASAVLKQQGISPLDMTIYKKSLDARRKSDIHFEYTVMAGIDNAKESFSDSSISFIEDTVPLDMSSLKGENTARKKIVIVGSGPCGLFAAYVLAYCGADVTVLERGGDVDKRRMLIDKFWQGGALDKNTNVQFGEGGAGTFSDGKLNTRIGDPLQRFVLETFVGCGAPKEILYQSKPHIGTDILKICVKNLRQKIEEFGGKVLFETQMTDIKIKNGHIVSAVTDSAEIECDKLILAIGHSSRDTYEMLCRKGVAMEQKPFAAGVRIEHRREFINRAQYGNMADSEVLPTADYRLAYNGEDRSCYSFCMCPGGVVVNASSEDGCLVVNGMSNHSRMADNSNSALVVSVRPSDFDGDSPLAGVEFQRKYEALAYNIADGKGPVQLARDFMKDRISQSFDGVNPSFTGETEFVALKECLPEFITSTLKEGLLDFDKRMKGFLGEGAILTGVEMRTSAPLRIIRDKNFESISCQGLFPAGEGAGYAGGIMSAAIDGIKIAKHILEN
ncbi:MAG: FAD-dependent oxidoreductase [Clostridia bacterium]|nr:FAD-dependent oxidoreductase [Clostridia bacterium]